MPRTIRFHLDENCHRAVAEGLRRRGIDVTTTAEAGLMRATDEEQMAYAVRENRVLLTHDRHFLQLHSSGHTHTGIAYCDKDSRSIGEFLRSLILIWEILDPQDMLGKVEFL